MEQNLYYVAPSDEAFEELREKAIEVWESLGSDARYKNEKIGRIANLGNVGDNFMYMVAMFDPGNQRKLAGKLSDATRQDVRDRLIAGGADLWNIYF